MAEPRVKAWFEILEFACDPQTISSHLALIPTRTWKAGETPPWRRRPEEVSGWRLASPLDAPHDLETHASWLLDQFPTHLDLSGVSRAWRAQIVFVVEVQDETPAMAFSAETLARIAKIGADLDIDVYVFSKEEWE